MITFRLHLYTDLCSRSSITQGSCSYCSPTVTSFVKLEKSLCLRLFLCYIVSHEGLCMDPQTIKVVVEWTVEEVQKFLWSNAIFNYWFFPRFSSIAPFPLSLKWGQAHRQSSSFTFNLKNKTNRHKSLTELQNKNQMRQEHKTTQAWWWTDKLHLNTNPNIL